MKKLTRKDLWSLEEYAEKRSAFRDEVIKHKKDRQVILGGHVRLCFEDRITIKYQVQEMLRIEKIFEAEGIEEELAAYNPLIPDGANWKATLMIEYPDVEVRRERLKVLRDIENKIWLRTDDYKKVYPIANEDLDRTTDEKTSSVHFLRFELSGDMVKAARQGAAIIAGVEHEQYRCEPVTLPDHVRQSLVTDLD